jgi:hypothetical protein
LGEGDFITRPKNYDLPTLFSGMQNEMEAIISTGRSFNHPGAKGEDSESCWLNWFQEYLPHRYKATKAFVMDSKGGLSDEIDIVIFDRHYSPFLLYRKKSCFIPAESVYAVFEVKQNLNKKNMEYAKLKTRSVRKLHRTSVPIPSAAGVIPKRVPPRILSGILTYNCNWKPIFGSPFLELIRDNNNDDQIDMVCSISEGSFEIEYKKLDNEKVEENIRKETSKKALSFFHMRLLSRLQDLATVPAIDFDAYLNSI